MSDQEQKSISPDEVRDSLSTGIGLTQINLKALPRRIAEVLEEIAPQGTRVKLAEWLGTEITIHSIRFFQSQHGPCAFLLFTDSNGELFNALCSWRVVLPKLAAIADQLPVTATFASKEGGQKGHYYDVE